MKKIIIVALLALFIGSTVEANGQSYLKSQKLLAQGRSMGFRSKQRLVSDNGILEMVLYTNHQLEIFGTNGEYLVLGSWEIKNGKIVLYNNKGEYVESCSYELKGGNIAWLKYRGLIFYKK